MMMKRIITTILSAGLIIGLTACGNSTNETITASDSPAANTTETESTEAAENIETEVTEEAQLI